MQACAQQETFRIQGKAEGFAEDSKIALVLAATHADEQPLVEGVVKGGAFILSGEMQEARLCHLLVTEPDGTQDALALMVENGNIALEIKKGEALSQGYMNVELVGLEGSQADKIFREKMAFRDSLDNMYFEMNAKYQDVQDRLNKAYQANDGEAAQEIKSSEEYQAYSKAQMDFFHATEEKMFANFRRNGDSFWGPLLTLHCISYFPPTDKRFAEMYNSFSDAAKNSFYGQILKKQLFVESLKGKPVPAFTLPDRDGKEWSDSQLREGKKCLLIDFWASWCGPCRKSVPLLKELYKEYASQGLEIVSISIDKDEAAWHKALDEEQFPWCNLLDTKSVFPEKYNGKAIPTFILVDGNGEVVDDALEAKDLKEAIQKQLNN